MVDCVHSVAHCSTDGIVKVAKTGMGSSAALVASLVGALLSFFGAAHLPCFDNVLDQESARAPDRTVPGVNESLDLTHNLAQACHCVAQGKVQQYICNSCFFRVPGVTHKCSFMSTHRHCTMS